MSLDPHLPHEAPGAPGAPDAAGHADNYDYWHALINEREAGDFLGLSDRAMQKMRQTGGGAPYIRISSRCLRYRRVDLRTWAEARMRSSTSDPGQGVA